MDQVARDHEYIDTSPASSSATSNAKAGGQTVFNTFNVPPEGKYEVGHLTVSPAGEVAVAYPSTCPVAFEFSYRGVPFQAQLPGDLDAPLTIKAVVGVLPYSAETIAGRKATQDILKLAQPASGSFSLETDGRIRITFTAQVPRPRTPVTVVATVGVLLVELRPYLDLLDAVGALRPRQKPARN
ncbi:hypothetical protein [Rhodovibrio salinarum]|uniref:Uncharacterized protein n=1 Tax=Rhodovibrio salinarum TaxID=1087 RepID=A0A934V171_9PROT|nr:hypothetical protein [Rhodovibrio salinarum]MBK1698426.1 hypothetical protein [Rhodovibrio salinarum]